MPDCSDKPSFLWWRLASVVLLLGLTGWRFLGYCNPQPNRWQIALFLTLLILVLLETGEADLYRSHYPWELRLLAALPGIGQGLINRGRHLGCAVLVMSGIALTVWPTRGSHHRIPLVRGVTLEIDTLVGLVLFMLGIVLFSLLLWPEESEKVNQHGQSSYHLRAARRQRYSVQNHEEWQHHGKK